MKIKCIRCLKFIDSPNIKNAKYIINEADEKTLGPRKVTEFVLLEDKTEVLRRNKFNQIQIDYKTRVAPHNANVDQKKAELDMLKESFDPKTASEEEKQGITQKGSALKEAISNRNKISVQEQTSVKSVSKTGIICRDESCQNENDTIIWG